MEIWLNQSSTDDFILLDIFSHSPTDLVLFSVVMVVFTVAFCGKILLLFLICIDPRLHTPMYFFLIQLSLMDLMLVCTHVPKMVVNFLSGRKSISFVGCGIKIGLFVLWDLRGSSWDSWLMTAIWSLATHFTILSS